MNSKYKIVIGIVAIIFISSAAGAFEMNSTSYVLSSITDSSGENLNSSSYQITTAVGEPVLGFSASANFKLYSGIFYPFTLRGEENVTYDLCDLNKDGIIYRDWNDLNLAYKCFLGIENCIM